MVLVDFDPIVHSEAVGRLFEAVEASDGVPALSEHKMLRLGGDGHEVVVAEGAEIGGYAQAARHRSSGPDGGDRWAVEIVALDPAKAAEALEGVTAALPRHESHTVWAWSPRLRAVLEAAGYRETRRLYRLERALPVAEASQPPPDITLAAFRRGIDEAAWLEANNAAFAGHPENGDVTLDDLVRRLSQEWFDPAGLLMAWEGDRLVGSCWTKRHPGHVGEIYIIGVRPEARGKGLGRALVVAGLDDLYARQGCTTGMLYVDGDNAAAVWLYTDLGFESVFVNSEYAPAATASIGP